MSIATAFVGPFSNNIKETDPAMWETTDRLSPKNDSSDDDEVDVDGTKALLPATIRTMRMTADLVNNMGSRTLMSSTSCIGCQMSLMVHVQTLANYVT